MNRQAGHYKKTNECLCKYCHKQFLATSPYAEACQEDSCQRAKRKEADHRRRQRKLAERRI